MKLLIARTAYSRDYNKAYKGSGKRMVRLPHHDCEER